MNLTERVAMAMHKDNKAWGRLHQEDKDLWLDMATDAIKAHYEWLMEMELPDDVADDGAFTYDHPMSSREWAKESFKAMIKALADRMDES